MAVVGKPNRQLSSSDAVLTSLAAGVSFQCVCLCGCVYSTALCISDEVCETMDASLLVWIRVNLAIPMSTHYDIFRHLLLH